MHIEIPQDVETKTGSRTTWLEAGKYPLERLLPDGKFLIQISDKKERLLAIVNSYEARLVSK